MKNKNDLKLCHAPLIQFKNIIHATAGLISNKPKLQVWWIIHRTIYTVVTDSCLKVAFVDYGYLKIFINH